MYLLQGAESFWEANRFSDSKEIPRILWNPKVHYRICTCPPPVHRDMWRIELVQDSLGQFNPVRAPFQPKPWRSILILSSFPRLGPPSCFNNISGTDSSCSGGRQVAVCSAIQTASLLNATGVSPLFSFSHSTLAVVATSVSLLLAVWSYLATGNCFISLHYQYTIGATTVREIVRVTGDAIRECLKPACMSARDKNDWIRTADEFCERTNFPNCIGAVDGKHIRIRKPNESGSQFFN